MLMTTERYSVKGTITSVKEIRMQFPIFGKLSAVPLVTLCPTALNDQKHVLFMSSSLPIVWIRNTSTPQPAQSRT